MEQYTVIVNTTPLGMFPNVNSCPDIPYDLLTPNHLLYDLLYNPDETLFMKKEKKKGLSLRTDSKCCCFRLLRPGRSGKNNLTPLPGIFSRVRKQAEAIFGLSYCFSVIYFQKRTGKCCRCSFGLILSFIAIVLKYSFHICWKSFSFSSISSSLRKTGKQMCLLLFKANFDRFFQIIIISVFTAMS